MNAGSQELPRLDVVIGNNFGHLPMFVGAEKGIFKKHGIDAHMKVVDTGTDMVNAMHNGEAQIGDMSVTTFLKAVRSEEQTSELQSHLNLVCRLLLEKK